MRNVVFSAVFTLLAASPAAAAEAHPAAALSSMIGLLTIFLLSLGGAAGILGLSVLAVSSDATRGELEAMSRAADATPRKTLAVGLVVGAAGLLVSIFMMQAPPLKLFGLLLFGALVTGVVKGFISRVLSAGDAIASRLGEAGRFPFREAVLGTAALEMVFLFPLIGQVVVALVAAQGLGAWLLQLNAPAPQPPPAPAA